jgi:general secretion pathway protein F
MQYQVRYLQLGDTEVRQELIDSPDEHSARGSLQALGHTVLSIRKNTEWKVRRNGVRSNVSYSQFCREIRTLILAGMTVVEAVETIGARERMESQNQGLSTMLLQRLQQGLSLSAALHQMPNVPPVLIAAVRAGERTSNLAQSLDDYLRFDQLVSQLRSKIVSAAIYPALVTALGTGISLFLLLVVIPDFSSMYVNLRGSASGTMGFTIQVSEFVAQHKAELVTGLVLAGAGLTLWIYSGDAKRSALEVCAKMPWIRNRMQDFQLAMMYQALALLLKGGYPMTQALEVAAQSALSERLSHALARARARIEAGSAVSQSLGAEGLCDEVGRRLMFAAERNGDFHLVADVVSRMHGERFETFVERVSRIAEPVLLLAVALLVGGIVVMMYLPVFDLGTQLR